MKSPKYYIQPVCPFLGLGMNYVLRFGSEDNSEVIAAFVKKKHATILIKHLKAPK
jgi:hypothetical protein